MRKSFSKLYRFNDLEYINYVVSSPASFGDGKKPEVIAKELFSEKFLENASFTRKKLNNKKQKEFERVLESEATWHLDKEILKRATSSTVKFTPHHYYNEPLLNLLKNPNLRQIWASTNNNSDEEFWIKLAQFGLSGAFNGDICYLKVVMNMKFLEKLLLDFQFKEFNSITITNPSLVLENFLKFSQVVSSINWNGPIVVMIDSTKLRPKLVYFEELNYISGSTLPYSSTSIETLENIHPKINYILKNDAVATQVRASLKL
ncbi:hypothetical protein F8M41_012458 [Gigaspora margarita]|uniref:Uncharacterized protein n=1 Tax=Gigaspora margarita TaxID=4874 RepID=A0A8H3WY77_GIGMA|nr:hypothetical protein F8M41_012458 [Gigaspora margarita]